VRQKDKEGNEGSPAVYSRLRNQRTSTPGPLQSSVTHTTHSLDFRSVHSMRNPSPGHSRTFFPPYFLFSSIHPILPSLRRTLRNYRTEGKCFIYIEYIATFSIQYTRLYDQPRDRLVRIMV